MIRNRLQVARDAYGAYVSGDRDVLEQTLTGDFTFYSPPDPGIDRAAYFERCRPNSRTIAATEALTFAGAKIRKVEVYFGWDVE